MNFSLNLFMIALFALNVLYASNAYGSVARNSRITYTSPFWEDFEAGMSLENDDPLGRYRQSVDDFIGLRNMRLTSTEMGCIQLDPRYETASAKESDIILPFSDFLCSCRIHGICDGITITYEDDLYRDIRSMAEDLLSTPLETLESFLSPHDITRFHRRIIEELFKASLDFAKHRHSFARNITLYDHYLWLLNIVEGVISVFNTEEKQTMLESHFNALFSRILYPFSLTPVCRFILERIPSLSPIIPQLIETHIVHVTDKIEYAMHISVYIQLLKENFPHAHSTRKAILKALKSMILSGHQFNIPTYCSFLRSFWENFPEHYSEVQEVLGCFLAKAPFTIEELEKFKSLPSHESIRTMTDMDRVVRMLESLMPIVPFRFFQQLYSTNIIIRDYCDHATICAFMRAIPWGKLTAREQGRQVDSVKRLPIDMLLQICSFFPVEHGREAIGLYRQEQKNINNYLCFITLVESARFIRRIERPQLEQNSNAVEGDFDLSPSMVSYIQARSLFYQKNGRTTLFPPYEKWVFTSR